MQAEWPLRSNSRVQTAMCPAAEEKNAIIITTAVQELLIEGDQCGQMLAGIGLPKPCPLSSYFAWSSSVSKPRKHLLIPVRFRISGSQPNIN